MNSKILIVDDEVDICDLIELNLRSAGFEQIKTVHDGNDAIKIIYEWCPDLIILDLMLPGADGLSVCKTLKSNAKTSSIPVIMLTARSSESDILQGFEYGADDYVTKPFSNKVLVARIKAHLKNTENSNVITYKNLSLNLSTRIAKLDDKTVELTYSEFEIIMYFAKHKGRVYTRAELISFLRGDDGFDITERAIDVQIVNLRRKLGSFGVNIETVRGIGYKLKEV